MPDWRPERSRLLNPVELRALFRLNRDIFVRTMLLIAAFTYTTRLGSLQGDVMLAANALQLCLDIPELVPEFLCALIKQTSVPTNSSAKQGGVQVKNKHPHSIKHPRVSF